MELKYKAPEEWDNTFIGTMSEWELYIPEYECEAQQEYEIFQSSEFWQWYKDRQDWQIEWEEFRESLFDKLEVVR